MEPLRCGEDRRDFDWEQPLAVDGWGFTLAGTRFIPADVFRGMYNWPLPPGTGLEERPGRALTILKEELLP